MTVILILFALAVTAEIVIRPRIIRSDRNRRTGEITVFLFYGFRESPRIGIKLFTTQQ